MDATVARMRPSSVIVVTRGTGSDLELFWSQRRHEMTFLGGFWAFAGGSVDAGDEDVPLSGDIPPGFPGASFYGCAARELFEEMGLLVTEGGVRHVSNDDEVRRMRNRLDEGVSFTDLLEEAALVVDIERLHTIGRWHTPPWFDIEFDSEFFAVALTEAEDDAFGDAMDDELLDGELLCGEWTTPRAALDGWERAERYIPLPIRRHIEALHASSRARDVEIHSDDVPLHYAEWLSVPDVYLIPLKTPTLPPATHTNCIIVGDERLVVIDPGSPYDNEQKLLARLLQQMLDDGKIIEAVVITHHHPDHVGGVEAVVELTGCEVWGHPRSVDLVPFAIDRTLDDGEIIDLGPRHRMRCVHTPGHASDHICLIHERTNAVFIGDLIASSSTIRIDPPDGHMGDYLASLRQIRALDLQAAYPAHGWVVPDPNHKLDYYVAHRLRREEKVFDALCKLPAPASVTDIVPHAYDDTPSSLWPFAASSAKAHLIHLVELGRVVATSEGYAPSAQESDAQQ